MHRLEWHDGDMAYVYFVQTLDIEPSVRETSPISTGRNVTLPMLSLISMVVLYFVILMLFKKVLHHFPP